MPYERGKWAKIGRDLFHLKTKEKGWKKKISITNKSVPKEDWEDEVPGGLKNGVERGGQSRLNNK